MKTLEITTASGMYLVVELPEKMIKVKISGMNWLCCSSHSIMNFPSWTPVLQLDDSWQLIGLGKDHPKLVDELGLLSDNLKPVYYPMNGEFIISTIQHYNRQLVEYEQAEKYVFKNPVILKKQ